LKKIVLSGINKRLILFLNQEKNNKIMNQNYNNNAKSQNYLPEQIKKDTLLEEITRLQENKLKLYEEISRLQEQKMELYNDILSLKTQKMKLESPKEDKKLHIEQDINILFPPNEPNKDYDDFPAACHPNVIGSPVRPTIITNNHPERTFPTFSTHNTRGHSQKSSHMKNDYSDSRTRFWKNPEQNVQQLVPNIPLPKFLPAAVENRTPSFGYRANYLGEGVDPNIVNKIKSRLLDHNVGCEFKCELCSKMYQFLFDSTLKKFCMADKLMCADCYNRQPNKYDIDTDIKCHNPLCNEMVHIDPSNILDANAGMLLCQKCFKCPLVDFRNQFKDQENNNNFSAQPNVIRKNSDNKYNRNNNNNQYNRNNNNNQYNRKHNTKYCDRDQRNNNTNNNQYDRKRNNYPKNNQKPGQKFSGFQPTSENQITNDTSNANINQPKHDRRNDYPKNNQTPGQKFSGFQPTSENQITNDTSNTNVTSNTNNTNNPNN
jgi:hypothetical protein